MCVFMCVGAGGGGRGGEREREIMNGNAVP